MTLRYWRRMARKLPKTPNPRDDARQERLKQALKDNLVRRKAQAKARSKDEA